MLFLGFCSSILFWGFFLFMLYYSIMLIFLFLVRSVVSEGGGIIYGVDSSILSFGLFIFCLGLSLVSRNLVLQFLWYFTCLASQRLASYWESYSKNLFFIFYNHYLTKLDSLRYPVSHHQRQPWLSPYFSIKFYFSIFPNKDATQFNWY